MKDIAIIIVHYNSGAMTGKCIDTILKYTPKQLSLQLIVVDNGSEKNDYFQLKAYCDQLNHPGLELIRSNINTGFGLGNMLGYQQVNAHYVAFINSDTFLLNDCLGILKRFLDTHPEIAVVGGQSFKENGDRMVAFDHFASLTKEVLGRAVLEQINPIKYPKRKKEYTQPIAVNYVQGSFMFIRCSDFNAVGGFDTNLFLYYEETDLCLRIKQRTNKSCWLVPEAQYVHYHGASTPSSIEIKTELKISLLYIIRKHYGYMAYLFLLNYLRFNYSLSLLIKTKYWYLFKTLWAGAPLSRSMKTMQKINPLQE